MAIEPESTAEREKLGDTLEMLKRQDPTLHVTSGETGQTLISGMGELHLEIIKNRLLRDFNLNVKFHKPQVSYRETVDHAAEVTGECHRQIAGQQLFAELRIRMEPFDAATQPVTVLNYCPPEALSRAFLTAAVEELKACGEGGGRIAGFPLMKLKVTILGGEAEPRTRTRWPSGSPPTTPSTRPWRGRPRAAGADHEAGHHHARRLPGRLRRRPAAAAGGHRQDRNPRVDDRRSKPTPR